MKSLVTKLAILPLAIASTIAMAGTNLVENGSFENTDTVTDHNGQWQLFDVIPGWTRSTNAKFEIQTNKLGIIPAQDGEQLIELDSTANYSISQAIATTAGNQYEVIFYFSARVTGNEQTNKAEHPPHTPLLYACHPPRWVYGGVYAGCEGYVSGV